MSRIILTGKEVGKEPFALSHSVGQASRLSINLLFLK